jgi:type IX secretion system PorP/SprF family membrane protein
MKKIFTSVFLAFSALAAFSQQDAQFSQFMFNRLVINPGYAGSSDAICATLIGRNQWMGFGDGIPRTYLLSLDAAVPTLKGGVGLNVMQDRIGFINTTAFNATYAFRQPLGPGVLGIGANIGAVSQTVQGVWRTPERPVTEDASIPNQGVSDMVFDASFGLYYNIGEKFYAGISTTHIPASQVAGTDLNFDIKRHYYVMAGYSYTLPNNPDIDIRPALLMKTDGSLSSSQYDLNCNVVFNRMAWGGLSYRYRDAVIGMMGFQHATGVRIGYSYDFTTSGMRKSGEVGRRVNTHEIMLGYCFRVTPKIKISKHKNVRFL